MAEPQLSVRSARARDPAQAFYAPSLPTASRISISIP